MTEPAPAVPESQPDVLPYTLTFEEVATDNALPGLQSYSVGLTSDGKLLIVGGRYDTGLHGFTLSNTDESGDSEDSEAEDEPASEDEGSLPAVCSDMQGSMNFSNPNCYVWLIDPATSDVKWLDLRPLAESHPELYYPLTSTNQNSYQGSDGLVVTGGYGTDPNNATWVAEYGTMGTFDTLLRVDVDALASAVSDGSDASAIADLFQIAQDDGLAVTGGALTQLEGTYYLMVGQRFDGNYFAFDDGGKVSQQYTNQVLQFELQDEPFAVAGVTALTEVSGGEDKPLHRRDGNFEVGATPSTGEPRLALFGGVFKPGQIAAYDIPIWGTPGRQTTTLAQQDGFSQSFSQYEAPVVALWDDATDTSFATFFGGIGGHFVHESDWQSMGRCDVTTGNTGLPGDVDRNDGFPFSADITTVACTDAGCTEWVFPDAIANPLDPAPPVSTEDLPPDAAACMELDYAQVQDSPALRGASTSFVEDPRSGVFSSGIVDVSKLTDTDVTIGYVFGGLQAVLPLPRVPNMGSFASNALYAVKARNTPSAGIPASSGYAPKTGCSAE